MAAAHLTTPSDTPTAIVYITKIICISDYSEEDSRKGDRKPATEESHVVGK